MILPPNLVSPIGTLTEVIFFCYIMTDQTVMSYRRQNISACFSSFQEVYMPIVQARTGAVAYEERGEGTPLVLLHANPGDLHHFDGIIATLARSYRTIALDWPGYGQSTAP